MKLLQWRKFLFMYFSAAAANRHQVSSEACFVSKPRLPNSGNVAVAYQFACADMTVRINNNTFPRDYSIPFHEHWNENTPSKRLLLLIT